MKKVIIPLPDFPGDLPEFERRFAGEEACIAYLREQRWPDGFVCPSCRHSKGWTNSRLAIECEACGHQTSLTAGTILHGTRHPLKLWFRAMWWVCTQKTGLSAAGLKRILGISSMQTAWTWLQKLRQAMVRLEREPLTGIVEVDDALLGTDTGNENGRENGRDDAGDNAGGDAGDNTRQGNLDGKRDQDTASWKSARVAVAVEMDPLDREIGRIRLKDISASPERLMLGFVRKEILPGAVLETDAWEGFDLLARERYEIKRVSATDTPAHSLTQVRRVITLVRRWILGTHQGRITRRHLQGYLDEFVFRFNRRKSPQVGLLFQRLVSQGAKVQAKPYRSWIKHERSGKAIPKNR